MKVVQPIRDTRKLQVIKEHLQQTNERDYILLMVGINTGLRISDILPLRVGDVRGTHIDIIEKKTGKRKLIKINRALRAALDHYIVGKSDNAYLFRSRNRKLRTGARDEPITASMAYKMLSGVAQAFGVKEIGTHSMRKTFGYHFYQRERDISLLMDLFNHSEESVTLRYIGIKQDTLDEAIDRHSL
ncbi:site-specific integrase [Paenibacillus koleovorans]|uniref:site-specific integrase n=1 Tax=Paenibacillus koleovorans TaxID=121608 RepID=UPI000FD76C43|nr:site-specific integrase [Paenibacillus koleovorans]